MAAFPLKAGAISRFARPKSKTPGRRGEIDIITCTHRLLSADIRFKDLGLLVVEEQRFGVRHKEHQQLRECRCADPRPSRARCTWPWPSVPSVIDTPPDRVPIKTYAQPRSTTSWCARRCSARSSTVAARCTLHNRVQSIYYVADKLKQLVPEAEVGGHSSSANTSSMRRALDFFSGKDDVLVCTTIIESGLDVPNANTIVIDDATTYGLPSSTRFRRVGRRSL